MYGSGGMYGGYSPYGGFGGYGMGSPWAGGAGGSATCRGRGAHLPTCSPCSAHVGSQGSVRASSPCWTR